MYLHFRLPLHPLNWCRRALLWRGGIILFWSPEALSWRPFVTHLCSFFLQHNRALSWRKGLRFNKFSIRIQGDTNTQSPPKKGKQVRQSQQAPQTHPSESQAHNQTRHQGLRKTTTTTLQIFPLIEDVKGIRRNKTDTPSFSTHRIVLFFLSISFLSSSLFPYFLLFL